MEYCADAEYTPCPDVLGYRVEYELLQKEEVYSVCGKGTAACALLDFDSKTCTILIKPEDVSDMQTVMHELNHCKGWTHQHDRPSAYHRPWIKIETLKENNQ